MSELSSSNRIAKNTLFLYFRMFFVMIITIYISRVALNTLGVSDYGIYNVVAGFVSLFGFLNSTLSASVQRFYNFELGKNNISGVSSIYTLGLLSSAIINIFLLLLLETLGLWYVNNVLVVPEDRIVAANMSFQASVASMVFVVMQIPYVGAILAYERMDFYAIVSVLEVILKLAAVVVLPFFLSDKLVIYSILYALISLIVFLIYFIYSKSRFQSLVLKRKIETDTFKELLSFSGWNLVGTFAFIANGQGMNLLLNFFFGPVVNAARAISFQVSSAVNNFTQSITMAFRPQVVESYAQGDNERVLRLFYSQSKIGLFLTAIFVVPLIIEVDFILAKWLGPSVPEYTSIFTVLVLVTQYISAINPSIVQVAFATGYIKRFQIATSVVNISLIPLAWVFLKFNCSAVLVFVLAALVALANQTVCLVQMKKVFDYNLRDYLFSVVLPCLVVLILTFCVQYPISYMYSQSWGRLFLVLAIDIVITPLLMYLVALSREEKNYAHEFIIKVFHKSLNK